MKNDKTKLAKIALATLVAGAMSGSQAQANDLLTLVALGSGTQLRSSLLNTNQSQATHYGTNATAETHDSKSGEGKCGEGKCGDESDSKSAEGKCGEGKCGDSSSH